jgi:hypothetical protein
MNFQEKIHDYNVKLAHQIYNIDLKQKRHIFKCIREYDANINSNVNSNVNEKLFCPHFGFTLGEFAVYQSIKSDIKKTNEKKIKVLNKYST